MPDADGAGRDPSRLRIGTLNIRNTTDRWRERRHLLTAQLSELRPDIIGLQELRRWPSQTRWITRRLNESLSGGPPYVSHSTGKTGLWGLWEGIAVLSRLPIVERGSLDLGGDHRVSNWVRVALLDGAFLEFHNVHFAARDGALRERQANLLIDHLEERGEFPRVVVGDLNAGPASSALGVLGERLRSAHALVHGEEPGKTWPTPLRPGVSGGSVIDYVLVDDRIEVVDAWLTFDRASPTDPTLFASDHFGLAATVTPRAPGGGYLLGMASDTPSHREVVEATADVEATMRPQSVPVNIYETSAALVVVAPLPAVVADDVTIEIRPGHLRFWAHLRSAGPREYLVKEWDYGGYEREIDVPEGYGSGVEASMANGQLAIRVLRGEPVESLSIQPTST